jgi:hypothetical protein
MTPLRSGYAIMTCPECGAECEDSPDGWYCTECDWIEDEYEPEEDEL